MRDAYEHFTLQTGDHVESVPRWDMRMHIVPGIRSIIYTSGERGEKVFFHQIIPRSGEKAYVYNRSIVSGKLPACALRRLPIKINK